MDDQERAADELAMHKLYESWRLPSGVKLMDATADDLRAAAAFERREAELHDKAARMAQRLAENRSDTTASVAYRVALAELARVRATYTAAERRYVRLAEREMQLGG